MGGGKLLLTKNHLHLEDKTQIDHYRKTREELSNEMAPKPNGRFLWMRPRLAFHNTIGEPKKDKGFKHWLKYKLGKPPTLLDEELCRNLTLTFENRLYHKGHFNAQSRYDIQKRKRTAQVHYYVDTKKAYKIDTLILPTAQDTLSQSIVHLAPESIIQQGQTYNLEQIKKERARIETALRNRGFYYFDQEHLLFLADTSSSRVQLKLTVKREAPPEARRVYKIGKIRIAEDFRLEHYLPDTSQVDDYAIISATNFMKPKVFLNSMLFRTGDTYSSEKHSNSLRQLMGLRSYKYANARYEPSKADDSLLDISYRMTPSKRMSLSSEFNAVSKSNNFAGPGIKLSYKSRNFFKGAELFSINLSGRFEKQVGGEQEGDTAYEIAVDATLDLPRLVPFRAKPRNVPYLPNARIIVGTGLYERVSLYKFNTIGAGLEYSWRKNEFLTHVLRPIDISATNLLEASDEFLEFLEKNPSIRQSFEEQFIIGAGYDIIINKLAKTNHRQYYFNAGIDPSGNLLALLHGLTSSSNDDPDERITIFGTPVSQYVRVRTDLRYYFKTGKESRIATRLYAGLGIPYGNSDVMPYVKQFYSGGTNSIRAFRARSLGPGAYKPDEDQENLLIDQTGDIKLEANIEYRFPIVGYLKGALFSDIGNIWLKNEDPQREGGKFSIDQFYKELAVGLGFGLRLDAELVVIRFDWAFPVRVPSKDEGERWVFDQVDFFNREWRRNNLLLNFSIGYPF